MLHFPLVLWITSWHTVCRDRAHTLERRSAMIHQERWKIPANAGRSVTPGRTIAVLSQTLGNMVIASLDDSIVSLRKQLDELHLAIATAARERDIRRNVQLTLQSCRVRRQLLDAQAKMFPDTPVLPYN